MKSKLTKISICALLILLAVMGIASATALAAEATAETDTPISVVHTYINPPHPGQELDFDAEKSESEIGYVIDGVRWLDSTGNICSPGTVAELGKTYTVEIYIYANSGHMFTRFGGIFNGYINKEKIPSERIQGYANDEDRNLCLTTSIKCVEPIVTIINNGNTGAVETRNYTTYGGDPLYYHTLNAKSVSAKVFDRWNVYDSDTGNLLYGLDTPYYKYAVSTPSNITFEAVYESGKTISDISISGVKEPIIWISPEYKAQVDPDLGYEIWTDCPLDNVKNGVRWYDESGKQYIDPAESDYTFLEGRKYLVEVFIKAKDGYNFADFTEKDCTFNSVTGNLSKTVSGYSPLEYLSVGVTYESKDVTLEIYGPDVLVSSSLHAAGSVTDITAPFADGKVFTGWEITGGRGKIDDASKFNTQFWLPGDGTGLVKLKANYKDAAEELCPLIEDILIDDVSVGIRPAAQNLIADNEYNLQFNWGIPSAYYKAGYRLISKIYIPDYGWLDFSSSNPSYDKDCVCFTFSIPVTGTAGTQQNYRLSLTLVDPEGRKFSSALELNTVILQFHNIIIDKQPQNVTVANGQIAKTAVTARGNDLTYQWYFKNKDAAKFSRTDSFKTNTYSVTMEESREGRQVYCIITDSNGNSVQTETVTLNMTASVITQPKSVVAAQGDIAKVTFKAAGEELKYEWYYKNAGESAFTKTSTFTGNSYSVQMNAARHGRQVYCKITDKNGNSVQTETVTLSMKAAITEQPKSAVVAKGNVAKATVGAVGDGLKYEWYYKNAGELTFTKTASFTKASYSVSMTPERSGRQVYCVVTDKYGNTVKTETATLSMKATIITQPESVVAAKGETAKVTLQAIGDGLKYEWYYKNAGELKFAKTSTFDGPDYSVKMSVDRHGRQVYCKITDKYGNTVQSDTVTLSMSAAIIEQPQSAVAAKGKTVNVTVKAVGDELKYEWYFKNAVASEFAKTTSFSGPTYTVEMNASRHGRQIYCVITDKYGNSVQTETVTLSMKATITVQPKSTVADNGEIAKVTVKAVGDGLKYEWYSKNANAETFSKSLTFTKPNYNVEMTPARHGRQIYCVITDKYGNSVQTETVTLSISAAITTQPKSVKAAEGEKAVVTLEAVGDGLTYEWYYKNALATEFFKTTSFTGPTYTVTMSSARHDRQVYCKVTDMYGNSVDSDVVTFKMK